MSAISQKSITGITSITTPAGVDNQLTLHTNDTTQRVKVTQSGIEVVGVATFQNIDVDGHTDLDNVSIAGVTTFSNNVKFDGNTAGRDVTFIRSSNTLELATNAILELGNSGSGDCRLFNNGTDTRIINGDGTLKFESDTYEFKDKDNTISYLNITSDRKVGINRTSPARHLHTYAAGSGFVAKFEGSYSYSAVEFADSGTTNAPYIGSKNDHFTIATGGNNERLRIDSSGRIGIGTDTLDTSAEVSITNASSSARVYMKSADNADCSIYFGSMNDAATGAIRYDHSDDTLRFYGYNNSERLRINSTGNVQIGTSVDPGDTLRYVDIGNYNTGGSAGSILRLITRKSDGSSSSSADIVKYKAGGLVINNNEAIGTTGYISFGTATGGGSTLDRLRITSDGKIGIGIQSPVAKLHVHNSGTTAADHAYAHFTTGDTGSTISDGLTVGVAANQVASVNYREAGTLSLNTASTPRITILSNGNVGINDISPASNIKLSVKTDGLDDNTYSFSTEYRSGNNASGYTASGIVIRSQADNSNGEDHTAYIQFSNRTAAQNGAHGVAGFITLSTPDAQGTYGTGEYNFYCRNGAPYSFPNDPAVASNFWMSSLFKIKSSGELFGYNNLRIDINSTSDGILGQAYGSYFGLKHADQSYGSEYMMISSNSHTYISCTSGYSIYVRPSANSSAHQTIFAHDNTTFLTNVVLDSHMLRRNQHHKGHMEGGYNNIAPSGVKTSPIYTIGSGYNPNEENLNNMYGIGYTHSDASFIDSNVTGGWGLYVASDGDARVFLNASDGRIFANASYNRVLHQRGHLEGGHNNIGSTAAKTSPIYTIGSSYRPNEEDLSNMYGVGYSNGDNASFLPAGGWGMYVAADGDARVFIDATNGYLKFNGGSGAVHFTNGSWSGEHSDGKIQTHGTNMYFQNAGGSWQFRKTNGTAAANIASNGTYTASDLTFKKDVATISNSVDTIKKLTGRSFTWKEDNTKSFGVIAQEVETVLPELVSLTEEPEGSKVEPSKMVNYPAFAGHFIEAIKELSAKIETLEQENTALKARVTTLEG